MMMKTEGGTTTAAWTEMKIEAANREWSATSKTKKNIFFYKNTKKRKKGRKCFIDEKR